jgi:hypothetical protein
MDKQKKLMLFARKHCSPDGIKSKTKPEQTLSVPFVFRNCLNFNESVKRAETKIMRQRA